MPRSAPKAEFDAVQEWTTSVATGRTMEQIALDADAVYSSTDLSAKADAEAQSPLFRPPMPDLATIPGALEAAVPKHVDVELATLVKRVPEGERMVARGQVRRLPHPRDG